MANLVYKRVSTDQQSTARQNLVLDEAGIEDPVVFEEDCGTSSRLHPLQRPKFRALLDYARPGDTVHISEMFRLVRGTGHILDVLDVLHRGEGLHHELHRGQQLEAGVPGSTGPTWVGSTDTTSVGIIVRLLRLAASGCASFVIAAVSGGRAVDWVICSLELHAEQLT